MNRIVFILGVWLFPAACTALGAAGVFLLRRQARPATRRILCGMAAGIMLAASVWSLLLPAIARSQGRAAWVPPALGLILGAVGLLRLEDAAGQLLAGGPGHCGRMVLAVTLHNLPEGMVVGLAAALALHGDADAVSGALALSLGIGLQNIPEGAAVSLPLTQSGRTRGQSFAAGAASGLVEPLGAVLAFVLAEWVGAALPWLMSAAAGCMVCVTAQEMIPEAVEPHWMWPYDIVKAMPDRPFGLPGIAFMQKGFIPSAAAFDADAAALPADSRDAPVRSASS